VRNATTEDITGGGGPPAVSPSERQLVVVVSPAYGVRVTQDEVRSTTGGDVQALATALAAEHVSLQPLFGLSEDNQQARADALRAQGSADVPDLSVYYRVQADDDRLEELAERLRELPQVDAAYVKPGAEPASLALDQRSVRDALPAATADFSARQGYLEAPEQGVNAVWARSQAGGDGSGVRVIDVEGAWNFAHEDLGHNATGVVVGTATTDLSWRNHGTAVIGEIGADDNAIGVRGIAPAAVVAGASIFGGTGSAGAIQQAADVLSAGDILLIELHQPGPRFNFAPRADQRGYIAMEWFPDDLAALQYARSRGVIVVEAAGNGGEDLDDAIYDVPPNGFPSSWRNPFDPANPSSGAVMVGAGAPPPGTHGRDHGPDRSRLGFSNFGSRVDTQGWGREVTTTGGRSDQAGDLQGGADENVWYTDTFSGTSSASPIVVGALAAVQGILRAGNEPLLTPDRAVEVVRATGSPQQDAPGRPATQRIGNRPDIEAAVMYLTTQTQSGIATQYWDEAVPIPAGPPRLWLLVDGTWRLLANVAPSERDMVQRAFLGVDSSVHVWFTGTDVVGLVISGS
jgi:DNA-binding Lrp family transcriptional regulator